MSAAGWLVIVMAMVLLCLFFLIKFREKSAHPFKVLEEANAWFLTYGINKDSMTFCTYDEPQLARNLGATVIIGGGKNGQAERVGFALEVVSGKGVVESEIFVPEEIASHHRFAAIEAKYKSKPLIDVIVSMAASHRALKSCKGSESEDS